MSEGMESPMQGREPTVVGEFAAMLAGIFQSTGFTWGFDNHPPDELEIRRTLEDLYDLTGRAVERGDIVDGEPYNIETGRIVFIAGDPHLRKGRVRVLFELGALPLPEMGRE